MDLTSFPGTVPGTLVGTQLTTVMTTTQFNLVPTATFVQTSLVTTGFVTQSSTAYTSTTSTSVYTATTTSFSSTTTSTSTHYLCHQDNCPYNLAPLPQELQLVYSNPFNPGQVINITNEDLLIGATLLSVIGVLLVLNRYLRY